MPEPTRSGEFRCPVCAATAWREVRRIDSVLRPVPAGLTRPEEIHVALGRCRGCALEFNVEILSGKDFASLYADDKTYSSAGYAYGGEIRPKYTVDVADVLAEYLSEGELLEVGFLDTGSLEEFSERGWSVTGMDLDPAAVENAGSQGYRVLCGDLDEARLAAAAFDAVVAIAVLEHVEDPRRFLAGARRVLVPGGLLLLQLPNPRSLNALVSRASPHGWDMYGEPGHVFHYRRTHLARLLRDAGFALLRYATSTIRVRGKVPFWPGRAPRLEAWLAGRIRRPGPELGIYSAFLKFLDILRLGDTHVVLARKAHAG